MGPLPEHKLWLKSASTEKTNWKKCVLKPLLQRGLVRADENQQYHLQDRGKQLLLRQLNAKEADLARETSFAASRSSRPMETTLQSDASGWMVLRR